jgi:hypothetical protein
VNSDDAGHGPLTSRAASTRSGSQSLSLFAGRVGQMEIPAQMRAELLDWPIERRPLCHVCRKLLYRARQIDGTVIQFCESGCRSELGLPFSVAETQPYSEACQARTA